MTAKAGVVGWPIEHSLSPVLHRYWLKEYNIDGSFDCIPAEPGKFKDLVSSLRAGDFRGVNVTVPFKEEAHRIADFHDTAAKITGAVNLLVFHENGLTEGKNTDAFGLSASLAESLGEDALVGKIAVIFGTGGAARAAALAVNDPLKAKPIYVLGRKAIRAERLVAHLTRWTSGKRKTDYRAGILDDWRSIAGQASLLINATTAGMGTNPALDINLNAMRREAAVCDLVYHPLLTPLLKDAASLGHRIIDGLGMLMHQAVPSFEAFFGIRPKVTPGLREALVKTLADRG
ncbi:MAG TPA: shikimate dehydrogenase [Rhizomicrobium sp.]|nr:shikimate dehydrogenase [Rhizomicrobium sp.]